MSRQRNGNGSIKARPRADGTMSYRLRLQQGGEVHRSTHDTEKEAMRERDRLRRAGSLDAVVRQRKMLLPELMDLWIEAHPDNAGSTDASYESAMRLHIRPRLNYPVEQVTGQAMKDFVADLPNHLPSYAQGGRAIARRVVTMTKAALKWASRPDVRLIDENLLMNVPIQLPPANPARKAVSSNGFVALMDATKGLQSRDIWLMLGATGARKGEITPLLWDDVDLVDHEVRIHKISTPESRGALVEDRVKMNQKRVIPLDPDVAAHFIELKEARKAKGTDPIFPAPRKGGPIGHGTIDKWWHRDCKKAGIVDVQIHSLRHMFTTMMIDAKEDVNVVSGILGHSSPMVTLSVYRHVTAAQKKAAIKSVGGLLRKSV